MLLRTTCLLVLVDRSYLSDEGDDSLCAVLVHVWEIDLVTEQHQPLAELDGGEDHAVGGAAVLAVVVKGLQQQLWGGGAGEVQTHNLAEEIGSEGTEEKGAHQLHWTSLTSISGRALSALNRVMVFPEPGGPHSTSGLCSASHV